MSIIKGDIKKALGFCTIKIGELEIDLSQTTAKDIMDFQEMPIKASKGKKMADITAEDMIDANQLSNKWYVDYFMSKDPVAIKEEIELFVVKNQAALQKEFTIGFGIKTKEKYEADEAKAKETLSKKD